MWKYNKYLQYPIHIKKKDLKGKKIDLRNVLIHASGHYVYLVNA